MVYLLAAVLTAAAVLAITAAVGLLAALTSVLASDWRAEPGSLPSERRAAQPPPLAVLDNFNRANENPLSQSGAWTTRENSRERQALYAAALHEWNGGKR